MNGRKPLERHRALWIAVASWSLLIWFSSPVLPLVRAYLNRPGGFGFDGVVLGLLAGSGVLAFGLALRRSGGGAPVVLKLAGLTLAAWLLARLLSPPDPRSRLVELMHFVEFGTLSALAFAALGGSPMALRVARALLVVLAVGLLDESLQHALASRYGEIRDVLLNLAAGGLGVGYALVLSGAREVVEPHPRFGSWRQTLAAAMVLGVGVGLFLQAVHRGHWIRGRGVAFVSSFEPDELERLRRDRRERWRGLGPDEARVLLRPDESFFRWNDAYATEARFHVQARNEAFEVGELDEAAFENFILEEWFEPFLDAVEARRTDLPGRPAGGYRSPVLAHRWPWLTTGRLWGAIAGFEILLGGAILFPGKYSPP